MAGWLPSFLLFPHDPTSLQATWSVCCLLHAVFLLGLLFNPEDRSGMPLQNFSSLSVDYTVLYPRRQNSSYTGRIHHCEIIFDSKKLEALSSNTALALFKISPISSHAIKIIWQHLTSVNMKRIKYISGKFHTGSPLGI
jgi:hypothetical protein